jgi:hypothetical protein
LAGALRPLIAARRTYAAQTDRSAPRASWRARTARTGAQVVVIGMSRNTKSSKPVISGEFLTLAQVAIEFHLSTKSVQRRISRGEFAPFLRVGRKMLWSRTQLMEWFNSRSSPTGMPMQRRTRRAA